MPGDEIIVSVLMPTYNHQQYIKEAIDSFCVQKCDFNIELLINDDCSSDNTYEIAMQMAKNDHRIKVSRNKKNLGLMENYRKLLNVAKGKFIAILESDDRWCDQYKLQKQVKIMLDNPSVGMVATNWNTINSEGKIISKNKIHLQSCFSNYENIIINCPWAAVTVCFSKEAFNINCNMDDYCKLKFKTFDYPTWLALSSEKEVRIINNVTADYRIINTSISNNSSWKKVLKFNLNIDKIMNYTINKFGSGRFSNEQVHNYRIMQKIYTAISYNEIAYYYHFIKQLYPINKKYKIIKKFPMLYLVKIKIGI